MGKAFYCTNRTSSFPILTFQSETKPQASSNIRQEDVEVGYNSTASNGLTHTGDTRNHKRGENGTKSSRETSSKKSHQSEDKNKATQNSVEFTSEKRKPSIVAVLNQGLANLGERLCK